MAWLAPHSDLARFAGAAIHQGLIAAFFMGLLGYGLQVHETWFPFNVAFEPCRVRLNNQLGGGSDRVHRYKYFLETRAPEVKDRIHYFSSFYYMLIELSLVSTGALLAVVLHAFAVLGCLSKPAALLLLFGAALQLSALFFAKRSDRHTTADRVLQYGPVALLAFGLLWASVQSALSAKLPAVDWRVPCLLVGALVFERLGSRHWRTIIEEQIVLVKDKSEAWKALLATDCDH